jgi:hypothetical protein
MGKLNQDFRYHRAFNIIALIVFILFLALFVQTIVTVISTFETGIYTNTIADLSQVNNPY